jgi:uncharacterized protein (TIGR02453 family)
MTAGFPGFPKQALSFLRGIQRNNNREWFLARKQIYEEKLRKPLLALVEALNAELAALAPAYVTDPAKAIYRFYRDTRFSSDKKPYKTHVAAIFMPRGLDKHACGSLYFEVAPAYSGVAAGMYMPGPEQLLAVRRHIAENHERFTAILKDRKLRSLFGELCGDSLSRVPKGFPADHPAAEWLKMKQWYVWTEMPAELAVTPKLLPEILRRFRAALPLTDFLNEPLLASSARGRKDMTAALFL